MQTDFTFVISCFIAEQQTFCILNLALLYNGSIPSKKAYISPAKHLIEEIKTLCFLQRLKLEKTNHFYFSDQILYSCAVDILSIYPCPSEKANCHYFLDQILYSCVIDVLCIQPCPSLREASVPKRNCGIVNLSLGIKTKVFSYPDGRAEQ